MSKQIDKEIAKYLLQIQAVKLSPANPFTWASGMQSPIYCDNRITLSHPQVRKQIISGFVNRASRYDFDAVVGVATAGIPHGALLANALDVPFAYVRSKSKAHGRQNQLEGELASGSKVLVIEDLISTGGSALKAVDALGQHGIITRAVLAIFTYGFPFAESAFAEKDTTFETLTNYPTLIEIAQELEYINSEQFLTLSEWSKDPHNWSMPKA